MKLHSDDPGVGVVYEAMDEFRRTCLENLRSAFLPAVDPDAARVWTSESAHELVRRFIDQPDISKRSFVEKLHDQLAEVSRAADQLLVELTWLHVVISKALRYETKRQLLIDVASMAGAEPPTGIYDEALHRGLVSPGTSFATRRPNQLWLLIRFAEMWLAAAPNQRDAWLGDGWAFRELVFSLEGVADQTQRHALLHLVHPDTFEDSVSQYHKRAMASLATPDEVGPNEDVTIANVRRRLTTELGEGFGFYDKSVRERWQPDEPETSAAPTETPDAETSDEPVIERSAWLIRGSGGERVPDWLERGVCGIGFEDTFPFDLDTGASRDDLRRLSEEAGVDVTAGGFSNELGQVWRFVNKIEVGDYVVTVNGSDVFLGVVDSPPRNVGARTRKETVRTVEWLNADKPVARAKVAPSVYSKLRTLLTVSNITSVIDELERWVTERPWDIEIQPPTSLAVTLARADRELEHDLLLPQSWLDEVIELLEEKRQLVLYGPPGTGKTFVAQRLADHLTAHGGTSELVQFHPSYAYEDFFEGYRPVPAAGGAVAFEIKPGPLRRLAQTATAEPDDPHVLIVDEINRANLAKVFGELYFLLEYRDKVMTLQYSDEEFSLPGNLFVIGTMNTADRSIALVDAAMRRRFYFVEMAPTVTPIDGLLARWLRKENLDGLPARLLAELNSRLDDPDAAIGPSYLMTRTIAEPGRLERIWNHAILPLLEERFYGTGEDLRRFSYESVLAAVRSVQS